MSDKLVRHRFFWSFSIKSTEKWLEDMSLSGLLLCGIKGKCGFIFAKSKPERCKYCFSYTKFENETARQKIKGWKNVVHREKWDVYKSRADSASLYTPNRRGLYLHNNSRLCLYALLSSIILMLIFGVVFGLFFIKSRTSLEEDDFFKQAMIISGIFAFLILSNFIFYLFMSSSNSKILENPDDAVVSEKAYHQFLSKKTFENWLEQLLIRDGDIIKRFRPLWLMTPCSLEKWLMTMERLGLNIYKISKLGMLFYFTKGNPRNIVYRVISSEGGHIAEYINEGWQVVFSTSGRTDKIGRIIVISHAYDNAEPELFHSEKDRAANLFHITLNFIIIYFSALLISIIGILILTLLGANLNIIGAIGVLSVIFTFFIAKALIELARSLILNKKTQTRI